MTDATTTPPSDDAAALFVVSGDIVRLPEGRVVALADIRAIEKYSYTDKPDNGWQNAVTVVGAIVLGEGLLGLTKGVVRFGFRPLWLEFSVTTLESLAIGVAGAAIIYAAYRKREKTTHYYFLRVHFASGEVVPLRVSSAAALESLHTHAAAHLPVAISAPPDPASR